MWCGEEYGVGQAINWMQDVKERKETRRRLVFCGYLTVVRNNCLGLWINDCGM